MLHQLAHVLGLEHEHVRPDRDDHILVRWNNIESEHQEEFKALSEEHVNTMGVSYDYMSVTHYPQEVIDHLKVMSKTFF